LFLNKKISFILFGLIMAVSSMAQPETDPLHVIAPGLLRQDFKMLKDSLLQLHAGLYRYKSKSQISRLFDSCYATLNKSRNEIEWFALVSFIIGSVDDGHTECFLPRETINYIKGNEKIFPLQLRFIGERAYTPCETKEIPAGAELLTINRISVQGIGKKLCQYVSSDGNNQTGRYAKLNFKDPFGYYYFVVYGSSPQFTVNYKKPNGKTETKTLLPVNVGDLQCLPPKPAIQKYLSLDFLPNNTALLTIKSFGEDQFRSTSEDYKTFLASSFQQVSQKKIKNLIIDLRNNGGGDDEYGAWLYSYLSDKPFKYYASLQSNAHNFTTTEHPNLAIQQPAINYFPGQVLFLINGRSFSATAEFASIAKSNGRGKFIGEETGGGYYGNTSGARSTIILPNSKIRVNIPLNKYSMAVKKSPYPDRGIIPDYIVLPTITDILQNRDPQMEYAIHLTQKIKPD
jgi:hypothetical protein